MREIKIKIVEIKDEFLQRCPSKGKNIKTKAETGYGNKHKSFLRRYNIKEDNVKA